MSQKKQSFGQKIICDKHTGIPDLDAVKKASAAYLDMLDELRGKAEAEGDLDKIANYDTAINLVIHANYKACNAVIGNFK